MLIINDPSHICGRRDILLEVAQKAIDLDFDGLMIESHIDPDNAWSDAKQQVTPERLKEMLDTLSGEKKMSIQKNIMRHWKNCASRSITWMMN